MIQSKGLNILVGIAVVFALIISMVLVIFSQGKQTQDSKEIEVEYPEKIFGTEIISIEILADEDDWKDMIKNATSEQYIMADVVVNGTKFKNVGVRPKGNSSLTQVARTDSNRYSFRLQFNEYIKEQTCFGLESFVVNNMLGDNTYMKEYVSYQLMKEIGVNVPCFGYADIKVNGKNQGLYLAVELYNESYEQRVFGDTAGMLYNVKSMDMKGKMGEEQSFTPPQGNQKPNFENSDKTNKEMFPGPREGENNGMDRNFGGMGERGDSGGSLAYKDDNTDSYSAIFGNVVGKGTEKDYQRVIKALKALSEGKEIEEYFQVDEILRYLAVHTIVVNLDSYSSSMAQNYYVYERDGKVTILPWDYNLSWGGFQSGDASSVINFPIDTPLSGVEMSSRPLIEKLFANTEYLEQYHSYLQQLLDQYFANGKFEDKIKTLDGLISDYVKQDTTAFCTFEEYEKAISTFVTLGNLRAQSVQGQLEGTVPATTSEQKENKNQLILAEGLNLSDLGQMMNRNGDKNSDNKNGDLPDRTNEKNRKEMSNYFPEGAPINQGSGWKNYIFLSVLAIILLITIGVTAKLKKSY